MLVFLIFELAFFELHTQSFDLSLVVVDIVIQYLDLHLLVVVEQLVGLFLFGLILLLKLIVFCLEFSQDQLFDLGILVRRHC